MHIAEGVLPVEVLAVGAAVSAVGVVVGLRRMDYEEVPRVAVISSAFFVASLIHLQVGPTSAHLILNGLAGLVLGWAVFPALLVALLLQAVLFGFGGLTTLGVNSLNMSLPAVLCYYLFHGGARHARMGVAYAAGFGAGAVAILLASLMTAGALMAAGKQWRTVSELVVLAHVPVMVIEGIVTGSAVVFLRKVRPELLEAPELTQPGREATGG